MLAVADSSALVALATCDTLKILTALYEIVKVPQAVFDEVVVVGKPQAATLADYLHGRMVPVDTEQIVIAAGGLGQGELEAMALCRTLSATVLIIDDRRARAIAESNGIDCIGTLGVLLLAKHKTVITEVTPFVEALRDSPIHYQNELLDKVLQLAGE